MTALRHTWVIGVLGLAAVIGMGSTWYVTGELGTPGQVLGLFGALLLGAWAFLDRQKLSEAVSPRQALAGASTAMVLILGGLLAVLATAIATELDTTADLSREGRYSLSDRSRTVLAGLERDITLHALFQAGSPERDQVERLGRLMEDASDRVDLQVIDPLTQPARARAVVQATGRAEMDRLAERGTLVLVSGADRRRIESRFDEEAIINALVKLVSGEDRRVCWSVGHGERDPDDDRSPFGYGVTVLRLEDRNVVVTEERILTGGVPRDCEALVIAGPTADFLPAELEAVAAYVAEGGDVLILLDNPLIEDVSQPALVEDLRRYGIDVGMDAIIENDRSRVLADMASGEALLLYGPPDFRSHPVLDPLGQGLALRWPRSVQATDARPGVRVAEVVTSSERSWAETTLDLTSEEPPRPDEGEALGPIPMLVVAEVLDPGVLEVVAPDDPDAVVGDTDLPETGEPGAFAPVPAMLEPTRSLVPADLEPEPGGRVVVVGDADVGGNVLTSLQDNGDLVLGFLAWLLDEPDQLGTDAGDDETLVLSGTRFALLSLLSVVLLPGLALLAGIALVVRRRFL